MNRFKTWLATTIILLCSITVNAYHFEVDGIYYFNHFEYYSEVEVTGNYESEYGGVVVIPSEVTYNGKTYSVTSIGDHAFKNCSSLTSITIPESVTSIGHFAFYGCTGELVVNCDIPDNAFSYSGFTKVVIGESVTSIGEYAFDGCTGELVVNCDIPDNAFSYSGFTKVVIGEGVTSIGDHAFDGCTGELVVNCDIPDNAFSYSGFTKVVIGEGVTSIGDHAFDGCTGELVVNCDIPDNAFSYSGFTEVVIGEGVTSIGDHAFYGCSGLKTVINNSNLEIQKGSSDWGRLGYYAERVINKNAIINGCAFYEGELVAYIGSSAELILPEDYQGDNYVIGAYAFKDCNSLISITISEGVTSIGYGAFEGCNNLKTLMVRNVVPPTLESNSLGTEPLTVYVPSRSLETYCNADYWKNHNIAAMFTITYMIDGESVKEVLVPYGASIATIEKPAKEGYTFSPSGDVPETMPAEDIVINGTFTINSYNLIYMVDDEVYRTEQVVFGSDIVLPDDVPAKEGHTFHGWKLFVVSPIDITSNADAMLYSNAPCKATGYGDQFVGWHVLFDGNANTFFHSDYSGDDSVDGLDHYLRVDMGESDSIKNFTFTYTVRGNDATYTPTEIVVEGSNEADGEYDEIAILTDLPTSRGAVYESDALGNGNAYRYIRYRVTETAYNRKYHGHPYFYIAEFGMSRVGTLGTMPAHDVVTNALFTTNQYKVTFKVGDEVISEELLDYGSRIYTPQVPGKEGHSFSWGEVDSYVPAHDVTYEGSYSINSYTLTYRVDGVEYKTEQVVYGSEIVLTDDILTKEGYTFNGWDLGDVGTTMPARNVVANALFTINQYKVTFKVGDEVISEELLDYGSRIYAPQVPDKEGHSFSWGEVDSYVPAHDATYEGSYSINSYTLTYVIEGEIVKELSVPYGTAIASLERPVKEGYTFSLIGEIPETMPAEDTTLNGTFTINKYRVTFALNGVVKKTGMFEYGSPIEVPTFAEKEGYTLTWSEEVPATVPAKDVYYNAVYVAKTYQVYYFVGANLVHTADVPYGEKIPEYIYEPKEGEGEFLGWIGDDYETMPAHEVYFTAELGEIGTDIHQLLQDGGKLVIYNIQGRKIQVGGLHELTTGVYIINGKKVVIK